MVKFNNKKQLKIKMFVDIVFPDGNEKEFIELASRLGYAGLCFVYDSPTKEHEKIKKLQENTKLNLYLGSSITPRDLNKTKKTTYINFIKSSHKDRFVLEKNRAGVLYSLEENPKEDFMHHRASGLNQVLCKLANKNSVIIGFSFNTLLQNKKNLRRILGRMMQNIFLCRKYQVKTMVSSFTKKPYEMRSASDIISLFHILGMDKKEIKNSFTIIPPKNH